MPLKSPVNTVSKRTLILTFCLFGLLCFSVYNAGLTSILTYDPEVLEIARLSQLADRSDLQILVLKGKQRSLFLKSNLPTDFFCTQQIAQVKTILHMPLMPLPEEFTTIKLNHDQQKHSWMITHMQSQKCCRTQNIFCSQSR